MNGYAGKILRVNLTSGKISTIQTSKYEDWVGGHGMGSAIFFDLVKDKTIDGFDPANVVTLMTSPLSGTLVPAASGRTEVQGIGVQSYPIGWFTRSNFGGRFAAMLKYAGWDGVVIEGRADQPVWLDIRNNTVKISNCSGLSLWGTDTWECQKRIWEYVAEDKIYGDWMEPAGKNGGQSTQRPAVLAMGPAGENLSRLACLIHDASNASGQGGFGAVWGSKNLKAISVIGTGSISINDPKALLRARVEQKENYAFDLEDLKRTGSSIDFQSPPVPQISWNWGKGRPKEDQRPQACVGCHSGCRGRYKSGKGNEAHCIATIFYNGAKSVEIQRQASDLINQYGLNAHEMVYGDFYLKDLHSMGVLGPEAGLDCPLDFDDYGSLDFVTQLVKMIAYRNDGLGGSHQFGEDIAEGFVRAAKKWGRLESDLKSEILRFPCWGTPMHRDPRTQLEWGYGSILGERDVNEHDFDRLHWDATFQVWFRTKPPLEAEEAVKVYTDKMTPFEGDLLMLDYSTENMYSKHIAKMVTWHRHYTRFWKQSALFCDWRWPDFINLYAPGKIGSTGEAEPKFFNAVTGKNFSFLDGIELGQKIWNLDHAIWTLQGRHRDLVHFADFIYNKPATPVLRRPNHYLPGIKNGKWVYFEALGRRIDRDKFEEFKTRFYELQGWDTATGWPTEDTLASLGLGFVAEELKKNRKLGKGKSVS